MVHKSCAKKSCIQISKLNFLTSEKNSARFSGIQGEGAILIESIEGDYYSVMGFPIYRLANLLINDFKDLGK